MPALPDPCVPQQILISGECQTYPGATEPEPGTFDLAENLHNGRPYWIGGSGLLLYYVPAAVVAPNVGASWIVDTDLTPLATVGFVPAEPGKLPPFGLKEWYWTGCGRPTLKTINVSPILQHYVAPKTIKIKPFRYVNGCETYEDTYELTDDIINDHPVYISTTMQPQRFLYYDTEEVRLRRWSSETITAHRWYIDTDTANDDGKRADKEFAGHRGRTPPLIDDVPFEATIGMYSEFDRMPPLGFYTTWATLCGNRYYGAGVTVEPQHACDSNPCVNGGSCIGVGMDYEQNFSCRCVSGYEGESCEEQKESNDFWQSIVQCAANLIVDETNGDGPVYGGEHVKSGH
jgi:hypothetical protein